MAIVNLIAPHAVSGTESLDGAEHFLLEALAPLEVGFLFAETHEKLSDQGRDGGVALGRLDSGPPVNLVGQGHCDILHVFTISHKHRHVKRQCSA